MWPAFVIVGFAKSRPGTARPGPRLATPPDGGQAAGGRYPRCLLDALIGDTPGIIIVRARHPQHGVNAALHGPTASPRVENASKGTPHVVFDETQPPELIMHLEDGTQKRGDRVAPS